ncbi:MAG: glycogen-binding domain-containing protein [Pontiellaceae bacterium]|nr:glycogen-binding domain-containing protein [Pontiellaceae bacterium]
MKKHDELIQRLETHPTKAPEGFADRVMDSLPAWRKIKRQRRFTKPLRWLVPALGGAAVTFFIMMALNQPPPAGTHSANTTAQSDVPANQVRVYFELQAPGADQVELLGTFNNWKTGDIVLNGPNETGLWTATVDLPEGRYEYIFLVDGEQWMADPKSAALRPDGFGNMNTVIQVYDENNA